MSWRKMIPSGFRMEYQDLVFPQISSVNFITMRSSINYLVIVFELGNLFPSHQPEKQRQLLS